jgi:hypothetical protein
VPRRSAEAQNLAAFLPKPAPLPVPKGLAPKRARAIWIELVGSKDPSYFLRMDVPLLTRFCTLAARAEGLEQLMATMPVQSEEAPRLERRLTSISAALTGLAQKLRLTVAHRVERHAAARSSEALNFEKPWLIGGRATRQDRQ